MGVEVHGWSEEGPLMDIVVCHRQGGMRMERSGQVMP